MKVFEESTEKVTFGNKHGSNGGPTINSKTASVLSNFMKTNKQLQEHIAQLSRQNHELKLLEKLRPQLMELQHRITVLQDESFQFRTKSIEEIAQLTDRVQELTTQLRSANRNVEAAQEELKEVKSYADTLAARSEALNLIRNRKGRLPNIMVVTAEPTPSRLASIALGTGDIDCVYHFALYELQATLRTLDMQDAEDLLAVMVNGKRLKDISDLPLDLAV